MKNRYEEFAFKRIVHEYIILQDEKSLEMVVSRFRRSNTFRSHQSEVIKPVMIANANDTDRMVEMYETVLGTFIDSFKTIFLDHVEETTDEETGETEDNTEEIESLFIDFKNMVLEKEVTRLLNTLDYIEEHTEPDDPANTIVG